jgi:hypothetical protein
MLIAGVRTVNLAVCTFAGVGLALWARVCLRYVLCGLRKGWVECHGRYAHITGVIHWCVFAVVFI